MKWKTKKDFRTRRHMRVRNKVRGTAERPRMAVSRTNNHMQVQFIDDDNRVTLASASTLAKAFRSAQSGGLTVETAKSLGKDAADAARQNGIETVVFDRGGLKYTGRVQALADAAREAGLKF